MTTLLCAHCGDRTILDRCVGCRRKSDICICRPAPAKPAWLRNLQAKDMTGRAAA